MDLPGRAGDPTPAGSITLATHANAICAVARTASDNARHKVTLVAHSTAAVFMTQAAEYCAEIVERLVYVSAYLPRNGQSARDVIQTMVETVPGSGQVGMNIISQPPYMFLKTSMPIEKILYGDLSPPTVARARALLVPEPIRPIGEPVSLTDARFGSIPRDYVSFQDDNAIPAVYQERLYTATPCNAIKMPGSHTHWLADPGGFVKALLEERGDPVDLSPPTPPLSAFK
jgi:pimeloyl-ACP methyl ester carboxylesterase